VDLPAPRSRSRSGVGLCLLAGVAFAAQPVVVDRALGSGSADALLAWRYLLAGAVLTALVRGGLTGLGLRTALSAFALGAVVFALDSGLFYRSIASIPVPLASLVHYAHMPLVVGGAVLVTRCRATRRQIVAVALVVAGVALVSGGAKGVTASGVLLAFASALAYAAYMLLSARLLAGAEPLPAAALMLSGAGTSFMALSVATGSTLDVGGLAGIGAILESAIIGSVVAVGAFYLGLSRIGPSRAPILLAVDVPVGIGLSALVLGEHLGRVQLAGAALVVLALVVLQLPARRRRVRPLALPTGGVTRAVATPVEHAA
jgi:drug/metabolite transporter (DMT)-like permease